MEKTKNILLKSLFTVFVIFTVGLVISQVAFAASSDVKPAGTVTFTTGDASIVRADKSIVKAAKNDAINVGDAIDTKSGRLQLSLIDGGKVSLQPNTIYKINKYEFSGKEDGSEYAFTELVKGGLRTISGLVGHKNRDRYQLKTAVATIGIRGTEFTVNFKDNQLLMTTNHGSVDVCSTAGCLNAVTGQSIVVAGVGAAPKPSSKAAKAAAAPPASNKAVFAAGEEVIVPVVSLANYKGEAYASVVMKTQNGNGVDGVLALENLETNSNAQPTRMSTANNEIDIRPISFASNNSDGLVAWGRAYGGTVTIAGRNGDTVDVNSNNGNGNNGNGNGNGNNGNGNGNGNNGNGSGNVGAPTTFDTIQWLDYAVGTRPDPTQIANLTGTYNVFGSTAPMLVTSGGTSVIAGTENTVIGNFTFNFATTNFSYGLTVPAVGANYVLGGGGNIAAGNPTFYSSNSQSIITGGACNSGACSGALQGGNVIQGSFFGANGERIGLQYGINQPGTSGQIYGTAVLK